MYDVNNWPDHCPAGHQLGPWRGSLSYDTDWRAHWLYCRVDGCRTRILLGVDGAGWQVYVRDRGVWVPVE